MATYRTGGLALPVKNKDPEKQLQNDEQRDAVARWFQQAIAACHDLQLPLPTQAHAWNAVKRGVEVAEYTDALRAEAVKRSVRGVESSGRKRWRKTGKTRYTRKSRKGKGGRTRKGRRSFR